MIKNPRILVVDDHELTALSFQGPLRDAGFNVLVCVGGQQALAAMKKDSFEVVLTDMDMPGIDGLALTRYIRANHPDTKILLMTGADTPSDVREALLQGALTVFYKPVRSTELINAIARLFERTEKDKKGVVLLVDDHFNEVLALAELLEEEGYKVLRAESGFEAIDHIRQKNADIAVLDLKMPGLSGWDTYRAIKDLDPTISAIIVTGYSVSESLGKQIDLSNVPVIAKPFHAEVLVKRISEIMKSKSTW